MAILNFQKPDKVIMIDSSDEFEGKFEFRPLRTRIWTHCWKCIDEEFYAMLLWKVLQ